MQLYFLLGIIVIGGITANFLISIREVARFFLLSRNGIEGDGQVIALEERWSRRLEYHLTYVFVVSTTNRTYGREQSVDLATYDHWRIGDIVKVIYLPYNPFVTQLTGFRGYVSFYLAGFLISLIFPIWFFGFGSLRYLVPVLFIVFILNLIEIRCPRT